MVTDPRDMVIETFRYKIWFDQTMQAHIESKLTSNEMLADRITFSAWCDMYYSTGVENEFKFLDVYDDQKCILSDVVQMFLEATEISVQEGPRITTLKYDADDDEWVSPIPNKLSNKPLYLSYVRDINTSRAYWVIKSAPNAEDYVRLYAVDSMIVGDLYSELQLNQEKFSLLL